MAKPAKKKSTPKKPVASKTKKPSEAKPAPNAGQAQAPGTAPTPYTPKPIEGIGWPAFRYPPQ